VQTINRRYDNNHGFNERKRIMNHAFRVGITLSVFAIATLSFVTGIGCGPSKYLYLKSETGSGRIQMKRAGLEATLELSAKSLVDNKLRVINRSGKPLTIQPSDIQFTIIGTNLWANAVANYDEFIIKRSARLDSLCGNSSFQYVCTEELPRFYRSLRNGGFPYGTIAPGDTVTGYVAFDIPLVISRTKWGKSVITANDDKATSYKARLTFTFRKGDKKEIFTLPLRATVFNKIEKLPYDIAKFLL
jgi:hypothetical protein